MRTRTIKAMEETDKAYLAGIIDGEGCLSISMNKRKRYLNYSFSSNISVEMASATVPLWIYSTTGIGHISSRKRKGRERIMVTWKVSGIEAENLIKLIKNYIIQKKEEVIQYLRFRETIGVNGKVITDNTIKVRFDCVKKLRGSRYA